MVTDLLTFFYPGLAIGTAWTFSVKVDSAAPIEVWVFTPERVDFSQLAADTVSSEESYKQLLDEIQALLKQSGGLLIRAQAHSDVVRAKLTRVEGEGYTAPRSMLRLSVVSDPKLEPVPELTDLKLGEHLLMPVSAAAEQKLHSLLQELKGLPTDLESSVLNVLRRPSLEWRMERIERSLSLPPATQREVQRSRMRPEGLLQKLRRFFMWEVPVGPVAAALLLVAGSVAAYDRLSRPDVVIDPRPGDPGFADNHAQDVTSTRDSGPSAGAEEGAGSAASELQESLGNLLSALRAKRDGDLKSLYGSHFHGHEQDLLDESSPGAWGIAKLLALRWQLLTNGDAALSNVDHQARVKQVYASEQGRRALEQDRPATILLAWAFCERYGKAEMPATASQPSRALPLPDSADCSTLALEDAVTGARDLTRWVQEQTSGAAP